MWNTCAYMFRGLQRPEEGIDSLGAGVQDSGEPP